MADSQKFVQMQPKQLAGGGAVLGATSIIIQDFSQIDGTLLTMTDFGTKGWATLEPGNATQEEQISFTGVTQNANGTATLTGVKSVGFVSPYTETAGLIKSHAGGTTFIISNTAAFYDNLSGKNNDETITGIWTFTDPNVPRMDVAPAYGVGTELYFATKGYVDSVAFAGAPNASTTQKGVVEEATLAEILAGTAAGGTAARLFINPSTYGPRNYYGYAADAGASDAYAITLSPAPTAYADGMVVQFKANTVNTGACTLNVNALGAKSLKMNKDLDPVNGYIKAGQSVTVVYDGTNFQILSVSGKPSVSQTGEEIYAADAAGSDTYAITLTPAPVAYVTGMVVRFFAQTANTGACTLNVNALGAKTIKKSVTTDLATGDILASQLVEVIYDGTNFQILSSLPGQVVPRQELPYYTGTVVNNSTNFRATSNNDGTILFFTYQNTAGAVVAIDRIERDSVTGLYLKTHTTTYSFASSITCFSLAVCGSYLYLIGKDAGTRFARRYDLADLANVTTITISGTSFNNGNASWSDGTDLFVADNDSGANYVFNRYSISGTTITYVAGVTFNVMAGVHNASAICDGTNVFMQNEITYVTKKYAVTGGAALATGSTRIYNGDAYPNSNNSSGKQIIVLLRTNALGLIFTGSIDSNSAVTGARAMINPIGKF